MILRDGGAMGKLSYEKMELSSRSIYTIYTIEGGRLTRQAFCLSCLESEDLDAAALDVKVPRDI